MSAKTTLATQKLIQMLDDLLRGYEANKGRRPAVIHVTREQMEQLYQEADRGSLPMFVEVTPNHAMFRGITLEESK
jgi:hypothetical protein